MIRINTKDRTYVCPFCKHAQAYHNSYSESAAGFDIGRTPYPEKNKESNFVILTLHCSNSICGRFSVVAINRWTSKQIDLVPQITLRHYPDYIPGQIREDYTEACLILESSPKAAATLLRRCLQGMIHDFWNIHEKNLNTEITSLEGKVPSELYKAMDALRKVGNIGAHMEKDVNMVIDIEPAEAKQLLKLIELLFDKWYIARHDEEDLLSSIVNMADTKEAQRKSHD